MIEEPPQTASITFNAAGEVEGYTMGYVMDRVRCTAPITCRTAGNVWNKQCRVSGALGAAALDTVVRRVL